MTARIATDSFGPFDVTTLKDIVEHLDEYEEGRAVYVEANERLWPWTPAAVSSDVLGGEELERGLGFRYLADVELAKEAVEDFGRPRDERELQELLESIEEYGL